MDLTERQKELLKAIVELHVKSGESIASEKIEKEYSLGVSPATIRNEMVTLTEKGYLKQPHTSAGRVPTSLGFKVYIQDLMKEKEVPVSAEVSMRHNLWDKRHQENQLLKEAVKNLSSRCHMLALAVTDTEIIYSGAAYMLDFSEFEDIDVTRFVLQLFDEFPTLQSIIGKAMGTSPLHILFGEELGYEQLMPTSFIFCRYMGRDGRTGVIGVIGPARMDFPRILPYVKYVTGLVEEAINA